MMRDLRVTRVTLRLVGEAVTHQVLRLDHGKWAVRWRGLPHAEGEFLSGNELDNPMMDHGAILVANQPTAEALARQLAHLREITYLESVFGFLESKKDSTK